MTETAQLEAEFWSRCTETDVKPEDQAAMRSLLAPLRDKSPITHVHYQHSLRVALTNYAIAHVVHLNPKPALIAGALHDIGKALVPLDVLGATGEWTERHQRAIARHVDDGYRMLAGRFDFSAAIMQWHHRFQQKAYPKQLRKPLQPFSRQTQLLIVDHGRLLAIADVYDALHRPNGKFGKALTDDEIKAKMYEYNRDRRELVTALYAQGVLGTRIAA